MGIGARIVALLLAGMLPAAGVLAATPDTKAACSPLPPTSWLRDAGVTALSMQVREGRCLVEVTAVDGKALFRQQQMLMVLAQKACAAPAEATVDDTQVSLQLRLPKHCVARSSQDLFAGDETAWMPPRGVSPRYPREAMQEGLSGRSLLKAMVDAQGAVAAVVVERSSGHAVLDEAAVEELRGWRFTRTDAKSAVPELSIVRVPMRYELVE